MDPISESESTLAVKIRGGDDQALARLLEFRRADLLILIVSKMGPILRTKIEAEDVFQDVAKSAFENFEKVQFDERGPFGWICALVERKVIDLQRKFSAQKRDSSKEVSADKSNDDNIGLINLLIATITSPSKAFSKKQNEYHLLKAMNELSEPEKKALELKYVLGMPSKEIAAAIGKTDGATRVLITRSLRKLQERLGQGDR